MNPKRREDRKRSKSCGVSAPPFILPGGDRFWGVDMEVYNQHILLYEKRERIEGKKEDIAAEVR